MTTETPDGPGASDDDAALLRAHVEGDPDAFGRLFTRHRDRLWAVALRTTGNPEDAADALQDALISAFRRAELYRGEAAVTTWLHRIVVNAALDRLRRAQVRAADQLPDDLERFQGSAAGGVLAAHGSSPGDPHADPGSGAGGPPDAADPALHVIAADRRQRVLDALAALPPDQKAALVLVDLEGYPVAEAASILETPVGTVKSRCARGRTRLAVLLADLAGDGPVPEGTGRSPAASYPPDHTRERPRPEAETPRGGERT